MNRRRLLKILGIPALTLLGGAAYARAQTRRNPYYHGPMSDHFNGVHFSNPPGGPAMKPFREFLKWQLGGGEREAWPESYPSALANRPPARVRGARLSSKVTEKGQPSALGGAM